MFCHTLSRIYSKRRESYAISSGKSSARKSSGFLNRDVSPKMAFSLVLRIIIIACAGFMLFSCQDEFAEEDVALFLVRVNGKFGYVDKGGNIAIKPKFDFAEDFEEGLALVIIDGRFGYIGKKGKPIIKPRFDFARDFQEGLAAVKINGKFGYINKKGKIVIGPQFNDASLFQEGLAVVRIGSKDGFIDKSGKIVIEPRFDRAAEFKEGIAAVQIDNKWGFIDKSGNIVMEPQFNEPRRFQEGLLPIVIDGKWGYIDKNGETVISPRFLYARGFYEGLAAVRIDDGKFGKWGFIDKNGEVVIDPRFQDASYFSESFAAVKVDLSVFKQQSNNSKYFDKKRRVVQNTTFYTGSILQGNIVLASTITDEQDIPSKTGSVHINPESNNVQPPLEAGYNQHTTVSGTGNGKVNRTAPAIIGQPPKGQGIFMQGLHANSKWGYIDKTGQIVIKPQFDDVMYFNKGLAAVGIRVGNKDKWGYIDKTGKYIWKPTE